MSNDHKSSLLTPEEQVSRRWFEEGWGQGREDVFRELGPTVNATLITGQVHSIDEFLAFRHEIVTGLSDLEVHILEMLAREGLTATRWKVIGQHTGTFFGVPATGRAVEFSGTTWQHISDGKIVGGHDDFDFGSLLRELSEAQ